MGIFLSLHRAYRALLAFTDCLGLLRAVKVQCSLNDLHPLNFCLVLSLPRRYPDGRSHVIRLELSLTLSMRRVALTSSVVANELFHRQKQTERGGDSSHLVPTVAYHLDPGAADSQPVDVNEGPRPDATSWNLCKSEALTSDYIGSGSSKVAFKIQARGTHSI